MDSDKYVSEQKIVFTPSISERKKILKRIRRMHPKWRFYVLFICFLILVVVGTIGVTFFHLFVSPFQIHSEYILYIFVFTRNNNFNYFHMLVCA